MSNLFQNIFLSISIIFVLVAVMRVESKVEKLHSRIDKIEMFLNLDLNADERIENE